MSGTASSGKSGKRDASTGEGNAQKESEGSKEATETTPLLQNENEDKGNMCTKLMSCCFPCCYKKDEQQEGGTLELTNATETSICAEPHTSTRNDTSPKVSDSAPLEVEGSDGDVTSGKSTISVGTSTDSQVIMPPHGFSVGSPQNDKYSSTMARGLNPLSKYLGSLAQRIGKDDLDIILFHAERLDHQPIYKRDREKIQDALSLFGKLQELGHINESNCSTLVHLLEAAQLETLATEVTVRYEIGFHEDISDSDLKEKVNLKLGKSEEAKGKPTQSCVERDSSLAPGLIPCKTCQSHFKKREEELERKYVEAKVDSKYFLQILIKERDSAEMQIRNAKLTGYKEHDHCEKEQDELKRVLAKSKSDLTQFQDRLGLAIQEKESLEKQLEIAKKEAERVQDFHNKEMENAKSKSESVSQRIKDKLDNVTEERTRLEMQLEKTRQEAERVFNLQKENEKIKIAHDKLETDVKQLQQKLGRVMQDNKVLKQRLENTEKEPECVQDLFKEAQEKTKKLNPKEKSRSKVEAIPIGGTKYIGEKRKLGHYAGSEWTLQVLGSDESGTEPGQFNQPKGLAWHGDQLVICDTENHRIQILNKNKVVIEIIRFDGQFDKEFKPWDVAISPDGHFFITDIGNNQIIICDQNKKIIQIIPQSADIEVRSITVMAAFIFVTDRKGNSLIKYNIKDGKLVARVSDQFSDPHSVMATSNNHLLVSDRDKHVIHVLDSDLNFLNSYRNDRLKFPRGLDVDSHGNIYICKGKWPSSKSIVKLRSDGQLDCVLFEDVVYYPEFIAVNDDITTTIAVTAWIRSIHQIKVYSVST
ncbi:uncharacterized protein [Ptychodera flava]|uniref:uncharacterized protein n=1 Tax=Ptychodera flava TaxID=63121 RepID=UPI00396A44BB